MELLCFIASIFLLRKIKTVYTPQYFLQKLGEGKGKSKRFYLKIRIIINLTKG